MMSRTFHIVNVKAMTIFDVPRPDFHCDTGRQTIFLITMPSQYAIVVKSATLS
jgi:hypothetical protein